jgi:four helix bundle protein
MKNFKQLKVWQKGFAIAVSSFKFTQSFPENEKFGLCRQITKAAVSIPSNIAEGSSRASEKDYSRFLQISLGSCLELETQVLISEAVGFGDLELRNQLLSDLDIEQKMLISFIDKLNE